MHIFHTRYIPYGQGDFRRCHEPIEPNLAMFPNFWCLSCLPRMVSYKIIPHIYGINFSS